ncbi:MAG TPA: NADPH-dependent FMN reductase [Acidiferrobacteraceae bacterium]|nr:NADPH-dependent FMN reductase [Acidiferrobacteraceae bacterium]
MTQLVGICGSLRRASLNGHLLRAATQLMPQGAHLTAAGLHDIPLYNGDVEADSGIPPAVTRLKDQIAAAQGLLLVSPEYNHSVPGVLKNAIDWLSRPPADSARVFAGRPVAVAGASPSAFGTVLAQNAWLPIVRSLRMQLWTGDRLLLSHAYRAFNADGMLVDAETENRLRTFLEGFVRFVER